MTLTSSRHVRRVLVIAALSVALTPVAAEASVKNGAKCSKVGQMATIKKKKTSTDFVCVKEGERRVWRVRVGAAPGGFVAPGGGAARPGDGPTGTATAADCTKARYTATSSGVNNIVGCDHSTA
jgi:hypothetical protein